MMIKANDPIPGKLYRIVSDGPRKGYYPSRVVIYSGDSQWNSENELDNVGFYTFGDLCVVLEITHTNPRSPVDHTTVKILTKDGLVGWFYFSTYYSVHYGFVEEEPSAS